MPGIAGSSVNATLEVKISRESAADETLAFTWNSVENRWEMDAAHENATATAYREPSYGDMTALTLKYGDITKLSFQVTVDFDF